LKAQWEGETEDIEWTENTRTFLDAVLDPVDGGSRSIHGLDCRQALCRIVIDIGDARVQTLLREVFEEDQYPIRYSVERLDQADRIVAFIAREESQAQTLGDIHGPVGPELGDKESR
jgi:hypothetical protein